MICKHYLLMAANGILTQFVDANERMASQREVVRRSTVIRQ